ncbi:MULTISPECIES: methylated-DNA--[protein]-cysteine S-methyltransferase [Giesbergeria]|uniref:Methylated-DNA--protein-cysteine methyltransferase n=1 Tax=Giesbergeria sinuosa TaxID=80883 RepID=A0ABV9QEM8_9BURK
MPFHPNTVQYRAHSPWGELALAASPQGLCGLWFVGQRHMPTCLDAWPHHADNPYVHATLEQLQTYWEGQRTTFDLPLDCSSGTPFQQSVWQALRHIRYGQTCSYSALAKHLGKPSAVRAVAAAVGRNPISVIIPCHRVLGQDGSLTGYAGGLERKSALLQLESAQCQSMSIGLTPAL